MTDLRKAAEMALEALEDVFGLEKKDVAAIQALRQALAQPEQEPVCTKIEGNQFETFKVRYEDAVKLKKLPVGTKLYTAPPSKQEQGCGECGVKAIDGYALYCVNCVEQFFKKGNGNGRICK